MFDNVDWKQLKYRLEEYWQRLWLRKWANSHPRHVIGITIASVLVLFIVIISLSRSPRAAAPTRYDKEWFFDLNTGELFTARKGTTGPIPAPSGPLPDGQPAGVKAYVLTYEDDPNESQIFVAFLEKPDPEFVASQANELSGGLKWARGKLVRRINDNHWYQSNSKEGQWIIQQAFQPDFKGRLPSYHPPK